MSMAEPMFYAEPLDSAGFLPCLAVFFQWNSWNVGQKKGATNLGFDASKGGVLIL